MSSSVVLRFDASDKIGGGHAIRCRTLAAALSAAGWSCRMAVHPEALPLLLDTDKASAIVLDGPVDDEPRAIEAALGRKADLLVVDHYGRDAAYEKRCRSLALRIMAIDDLAQVPHECDYLLNQNPGTDVNAYAGLVPRGCVLMVGSEFALLRPEFAAQRQRRAMPAHVRNIVLSLGAYDRQALGYRLALALADRMPDVEFRVATGEDGGAEMPAHPRVRRLGFVADMAGLMSSADLVVGAGGTSALERCVLGLPSAVVIVAGNQRPGARALEAAGAAAIVGDAEAFDIEAVVSAIVDLARDERRLSAMRAAARAICDGSGAQLVANVLSRKGFRFTIGAALASIAARNAMDNARLTLRFATPADIELLFSWQTDPETRRFSRTKLSPTMAEHRAWAKRYFADPEKGLLIVESDEGPVGSLRLDWRDAEGDAEISIVVSPKFRGRGIGQRMLRLLQGIGIGSRMFGHVEAENAASRAAFLKAGFRQSSAVTFESQPDTLI